MGGSEQRRLRWMFDVLHIQNRTKKFLAIALTEAGRGFKGRDK
jgi:hypothetical protein